MEYKICQVIPYIDSKYGGPPHVAIAINRIFNSSQHKAVILTMGEKVPSLSNVVYFKKTADFLFFSIGFVLKAWRYIRVSELVVIHGIYSSVSMIAVLYCLLWGKAYVLLPHGMLDKDSIFSSHSMKDAFRYIYIALIAPLQIYFAKYVIFNSSKEKGHSFFGKRKRSIVIPNGVDLQKIDEVTCNSFLLDASKFNFLFFGRIDPIKGVDIIVEASNQLAKRCSDSFIVHFVGSGHQSYVDAVKGNIRFPFKLWGHISGDKKYCLLKQCNAYLQPSQTEGMSISMLEAMACRVLMITTKSVGLYEELAEHKAALLIDYDAAQLQEVMQRCLVTCGEGADETMRKHARRLVEENYSWEAIAQEYLRISGSG